MGVPSMQLLAAKTAAAAGGFSPSDISGLVAWYDASDSGTVTQSLGAVSAWADKSANGYDLTAPVGNEPVTGSTTLNGRATIESAGSDWVSNTTDSFMGSPMTMAAVCYYPGAANYGVQPLSGPDNALGFYIYNGSARIDKQNVATIITRTYSTVGWLLFVGKIDASSAEIWIDAVKQGVTASHVQTFTAGTGVGVLTGRPNGSFPSASGAKLAELIVYNSFLSTADQGDVETYLNDKWAVY
jgi:hypothetical protein